MTRLDPAVIVCLFLLSCVLLASALSFAQVQTIWVDETTQLSGLSLSFGEQVRWLSGEMEHPFAVPPDRMPPLSYFLGSLWASVFGFSEMTMRVFGIVCALCALPALFLAGRLVGGAAGGLFAAAFIMTSPAFIIQTVEIRAYPVFFCLSAWAAYSLVRFVTGSHATRSIADLISLTALLVLMCYTHFYGVVASGFFFLTLLVHRIYTGQSVRALLLCGVAGAVLVTGILPFVTASFSMTSAEAETSDLSAALGDSLNLVFRFFASPIFLAYPVLLGGVAVSVTVLSLCLALVLWDPLRREAVRGLPFILLPVAAGMAVLTLIASIVPDFPVLAPHYNLWLLPLVALTLAFAFALRGGVIGKAVRLAGVCLIAMQLLGLATLYAHGSLYTHGPGEAVASEIDVPSDTLVVLDASEPWGSVYFPVTYLTRQKVTHWLSYPDGGYKRIEVAGLMDVVDPQSVMRQFGTVMWVQTTSMNGLDLAAVVRDPTACRFPPSRLFLNMDAAGSMVYCSFFAARYLVSRTH